MTSPAALGRRRRQKQLRRRKRLGLRRERPKPFGARVDEVAEMLVDDWASAHVEAPPSLPTEGLEPAFEVRSERLLDVDEAAGLAPEEEGEGDVQVYRDAAGQLYLDPTVVARVVEDEVEVVVVMPDGQTLSHWRGSL